MTFPATPGHETITAVSQCRTGTPGRLSDAGDGRECPPYRLEPRRYELIKDFTKNGFRNWGFGPRGGLSTYRFRDPDAKTPDANQNLRVKINVPNARLSFRFRVEKNKYLTGVRAPQERFSAARGFATSGEHEIIFRVSDFKNADKEEMSDWTHISTFAIDVYDPAEKASLDFTAEDNREVLSALEWVSEK